MDLWTALAAAGAGYAAKNKKNPLTDVESSSDFPSDDSKFLKPESPPSMGHCHDDRCPLQKLAQRKRLGVDVLMEREQATQSDSTPDVASTSGFDGGKLVHFDNHGDCNVLSMPTLSPVYLQNEDQAVEEGLRLSGNMVEVSGHSFPEPPLTTMGTSYGFVRNRISLRSRQSNMQSIKPLTSLESCLMAQLCKGPAGMDEYVLSSVPLQSSPTVRPFFVTDGRRIISRAGDSFSLQTEMRKNKLHKQIRPAENEDVFGVPPLPSIGSVELPRMRVKTRKGLGRKSSSSSKIINGKRFHSLTGSSHGALLFGLGLSVGLMSSFLANRREVDKLNDLLKQTENLVQDLQDELEMKDALTVKELAIEDYESQDTCCRSYNKSTPHSVSSQQNLDGSTKYCGKELPDQKAEEDSESMSKIEAELEAELERLELNMNSSSLEGRLSDLIELDPDFIPEIARGELRPDICGVQPYAERDGSGTSTPHSANYAVSPRELKLRLHEVIQSRLEERVQELETALENSQRKVQIFMESGRKTVGRDFSDFELRSSSYQNAVEDQPVVINLSGEALDAYNEAHDEFLKTNESEEADLGKRKTFSMFDQNGDSKRYQPYYTTGNGESSPALISHESRTLDEHVASGDVGFSGDESDDDHEELEKLLIKQIVEKTRKGSSVILNAGKGLFSADGYES